MIDFDLSNDFSDFLKDTNRFFKEFNRCYPESAVEDKDRLGLCGIFLLNRISVSLEAIEAAVVRKIESG
jgi:hypothetical protein